jgi:hypothetical protein
VSGRRVGTTAGSGGNLSAMLFQPILFLLLYQFHFMLTKEHCRAIFFPPTGKELSVFLSFTWYLAGNRSFEAD